MLISTNYPSRQLVSLDKKFHFDLRNKHAKYYACPKKCSAHALSMSTTMDKRRCYSSHSSSDTLSWIIHVPVKCKVGLQIIFSKLIWYSKVFDNRVDWTFCWTISCPQHRWYFDNNTRKKNLNISDTSTWRFLLKLDFLFAPTCCHLDNSGVVPVPVIGGG